MKLSISCGETDNNEIYFLYGDTSSIQAWEGHEHWSLTLQSSLASFLCAVINNNVASFIKETWENPYKKYSPSDPNYKSYEEFLDCQKAQQKDLILATDFLVTETLDYSNLDIYQRIVDIVLLNKGQRSTTQQRYFAYRMTNFKDNLFLGSFNISMRVMSWSEPNNEEELNRVVDKDYATIENYLVEKGVPTPISLYYTFQYMHDFICFCIFSMIKNNLTFKTCPNCGKYFYPTNRSDTIYCSSPSPQDQTKSCGEYAKYQKYLSKTHTDKATKLYKQIYNSKRNRCAHCDWKNIALNNDLVAFKDEASQWKSSIKVGTKSEQEFIEWLNSIKAKKVL